jgi:hypothetical protein
MSQDRAPLRQRRDLSQIIEGAISLYMQYFWAFFLIAAVTMPLPIASAAIQETSQIIAFDEIETASDSEFDAEVDWIPLILLLLLSIVQLFVQFAAGMAIIAGLRLYEDTEQPDFGRAYDLTLARIGTLIGGVLRVLIVVIPLTITIIGIPVAIYFAVRWVFFGQAVLLDDTSAKASLAFSADAVEGTWWRTFGILIIAFLIGSIPSQFVSGIFSLASPIVGGTAAALVAAALLPFTVIAATLLYTDLQSRKQVVPEATAL